MKKEKDNEKYTKHGKKKNPGEWERKLKIRKM